MISSEGRAVCRITVWTVISRSRGRSRVGMIIVTFSDMACLPNWSIRCHDSPHRFCNGRPLITLFHECVTGSDEILSQPPILVNAHAGARKIIRSVGENQVLTRDGIRSEEHTSELQSHSFIS